MRARFGRRRAGPVLPPSWAGPQALSVLAAAGGAGASTVCALLAGAIAERLPAGGPPVAVADLAPPRRSPWPDWIDRTAGEGVSTIRGLNGVAVLTRPTATERGTDAASEAGVEVAARAYAHAVLDLAASCSPEQLAARHDRTHPLVLVVHGSADGVAAGVRALHALTGAGIPAGAVAPVVVGAAPGQLAPRSRARLALLDRETRPALTVPFDPAISRRGLADALAAGAVGTTTRRAVADLAAALTTPTTLPGSISSPAPAAPGLVHAQPVHSPEGIPS